MEQLQETLIPSQGHIALLGKSVYLHFVFILVLGFTLTNIGVTIFAQATSPVLPLSNAFLEYAIIFPGQPISIVEGKGFTCWNNHQYDGSFEPICRLTQPSGVFSNIDLFTSDGIIRQITFLIHDDTLRAGDLILLFGSPNFRVYPHMIFFFWSDLFVHISTTDRGNSVPMRLCGV